jgi:hypothetical protein
LFVGSKSTNLNVESCVGSKSTNLNVETLH